MSWENILYNKRKKRMSMENDASIMTKERKEKALKGMINEGKGQVFGQGRNSQITGQKIIDHAKKHAQADASRFAIEEGVKNVPKKVAKEAAKKGLEKKVVNLSKGSTAAGLTNTGLQMAGMKTDNAAGGGLSGGLQAASMTGNPYIIAGAAVLGAIQGEAKRKAHNKKLDASAVLAGAQAQSTAAAQKQKAMAQMGQAFQGYFS